MVANVASPRLAFVPLGARLYRVHANARVSLGDLYQEVDGFYVFAPNPALSGCYSEWILRELADKLKDLNADWAARIEHELNSQPVPLIPSMDDLDLPDPFINSKLGDL